MTAGMIAVCGLSIKLRGVFHQITHRPYRLFALISLDASVYKSEELVSWVLGSLKVIRLCALSINFLWFLAFRDLSCMFTQVGVYLACGLFRIFFFTLLRFLLEFLCLKLCERFSVMKCVGL